jgi:hypothetical protein
MGMRAGQRASGWARLALLLLALSVTTFGLAAPPPNAQADELLSICGTSPNYVFVPLSNYGIEASASCPGGWLGLQAPSSAYPTQGDNAIVQATAPAGLFIRSVWISVMASGGVNAGNQGV